VKEKGGQDPNGVLHNEEGDGEHEHLQDPEAGQPGRQGEPRSGKGKHHMGKVERQAKVLIKNLAIFFLFPSKKFLPISLNIQLLVILWIIWIMNIEINIFTVLEKDLKNVSERNCPFRNLKILKVYKLIAFLKTQQRLKQEWKKSPGLGPGKQTAKTWFGLEK
jgi:hypothetical protein